MPDVRVGLEDGGETAGLDEGREAGETRLLMHRQGQRLTQEPSENIYVVIYNILLSILTPLHLHKTVPIRLRDLFW